MLIAIEGTTYYLELPDSAIYRLQIGALRDITVAHSIRHDTIFSKVRSPNDICDEIKLSQTNFVPVFNEKQELIGLKPLDLSWMDLIPQLYQLTSCFMQTRDVTQLQRCNEARPFGILYAHPGRK